MVSNAESEPHQLILVRLCYFYLGTKDIYLHELLK